MAPITGTLTYQKGPKMDTSWKYAFQGEMKRKGMTFAKLAEALDMSVSGLKKVFQKEDISLERFKHICQVLDLDPSDLVKKDLRSGIKVKTLSHEIDKYLSKEKRAFHLFWNLVIEKLDLEEARKWLQMSQPESYRYLTRLDRFGLIRWNKEDEISVPESAPFLFDSTTICAVEFARDQSHVVVDDAFDAITNTSEDSMIAMRYMSLSRDDLRLLTARLKSEINSLSKKSPYRGKQQSKMRGEQPVSVLFCVRPGNIRA
jgi:transcriptional regulator with XRE-family HTH domain